MIANFPIQAYHSIFLEDRDVPVIVPAEQDELTVFDIGNFPILPLRTRTRGPAYTLPALPPNTLDIDVTPESESYDCVDEILSLFRANVLFRNFEINGPADRMLIYGTLFISECLGKVKPTMSAREAEKALINAALDSFAIPGDVSFPLNQAFEPPRDRQDAESLRAYISQIRQEIAVRLHARLYPGGEGPSKFWLSFTKRKFMGKSL
ncbi:Actin-related protein 2/3 complex subunit 3 [Penicillium rolfsii]|nr:Actin-related protein 2/3 complex subunit 3 [Penicillium rolfsii]